MKMETLWSNWKLMALSWENDKENHKSNQARHTSFPRTQEDYIVHVSKVVEGRIIRKLYRKISDTVSQV